MTASDIPAATARGTHVDDQIVPASDELAHTHGEIVEFVVGSDRDGPPGRRLFVGVADECPMIVGDAVGHLERSGSFRLVAECARCAGGERGHRDLLGRLRQRADGVGGVGADLLELDEVVGHGDRCGFAGARRKDGEEDGEEGGEEGDAEDGRHGDDDGGGAHAVEG